MRVHAAVRENQSQDPTQKVSVYTDTVTRSNVALYEHFGFQCVEESAIAGTGITVWAMRRSIH